MSDIASAVNKGRRKFQDATGITGVRKDAQSAVEQPLRTGASSARRDAAGLAAQQLQREKANLAEATDEVARRRAGATSTRGGRRSLIQSSPSGLAKKLGG